MLVRTVFNSAKQQKLRLAADAYHTYMCTHLHHIPER